MQPNVKHTLEIPTLLYCLLLAFTSAQIGTAINVQKPLSNVLLVISWSCLLLKIFMLEGSPPVLVLFDALDDETFEGSSGSRGHICSL